MSGAAFNWDEIIATQEDLGAGLKPYIEKTDSSLVFLKHPLVHTLYHEQMNALYNRQLVERQKYLDELIVKGAWELAIFTYERPYRFSAFRMYAARMPKPEAADLLVDLWQDTEFPWQQRAAWRQAFTKYRRDSARMKESLQKLPLKAFTVYRGALAGEARNGYGMSWTLDRERAEWFANRWGQKGVVHTTTITKAAAFAYLTDRAEDEVVVDYRKLKEVA